MRVLGVSCAATSAFLAVADDAVPAEAQPYRFGQAVSRPWISSARPLDEIKPDRMYLLLPESG
jgi:hypothetical protein